MDGESGYLLSEALRAVWQTIMRGNEYVDRQAPWKLAKDENRSADLDQTLYSLIRQLLRQTVHLAPFMPTKAEVLWAQLGGSGSVHQQKFETLDSLDPAGWKVTKGEPLFPKEAPGGQRSAAV
jgi:methionyl-tRNA synthetase